MADSSGVEDVYVSIPCGGPLFVADMVGPLTSVSGFRSCVEDELKDLRKELCLDLTQQPHHHHHHHHHHQISVDDLKMPSEEELIEMAFQATLKGANLTKDSPPSSDDCSDGTSSCSGAVNADVACSVNSGTDEDYEPSDDLPKRTRKTGKMNGNANKKSKRVPQKDTIHEEDYMVEVEKVAELKQKQEQDKLAARLHSFCGTTGPASCVTSSLEKKEPMSSFSFTNSSTQQVKLTNARENVLLHGCDILLCIEVYNINRRSTRVKTQEILVLGQQLLTALRDKLYCLTDAIMKQSKKHDPSGYFLIEDIFYNDLREASATDYSKPILDWLTESKKTALEKWECILSGDLQQKQKKVLGSESGPRLPQFRARSMQTTRFCDLSFRLGAGYLYCHQGDCRHIIVIRDMRLVHSEDVQNRDAYPLILFQSKVRFQKCSCCKIFKAVKVTVDDKWAPENPCYFCGICYYMLHYSDNKLIYDEFKVFDYIHD